MFLNCRKLCFFYLWKILLYNVNSLKLGFHIRFKDILTRYVLFLTGFLKLLASEKCHPFLIFRIDRFCEPHSKKIPHITKSVWIRYQSFSETRLVLAVEPNRCESIQLNPFASRSNLSYFAREKVVHVVGYS